MFNILLVDDDPDEYELLESALKTVDENIKVFEVTQCNDLLHVLRTTSPDFIFMDINMPNINGIECLKTIRSNEIFGNLPVIMYSTSSNHFDIKESFENKADLYVVKPDNFKKLIDIVKKILSLSWGLDRNIHMDNFVIT